MAAISACTSAKGVSIGYSRPRTTVRLYMQEPFTFLPLTAKDWLPRKGAVDLTTVVHPCRLFNAPWRFTVKTVNTKSVLLPIAAGIVAVSLHCGVPGAQEGGTVLSAQALREIAQVEAEIDRVEAQAIERLAAPPDNQVQQIELLGKLLLYDKQLSVNRNEACAFCHMPEVGFTGPVSELNRTTGSYPG